MLVALTLSFSHCNVALTAFHTWNRFSKRLTIIKKVDIILKKCRLYLKTILECYIRYITLLSCFLLKALSWEPWFDDT